MRIWDLPVEKLCRQHLLGEHRELHAIWTYLTTNKGGSYRKHPETLRWKGKLEALLLRHTEQVLEMHSRGYNHKSLLDISGVDLGNKDQTEFINTLPEQIKILQSKKCKCKV